MGRWVDGGLMGVMGVLGVVDVMVNELAMYWSGTCSKRFDMQSRTSTLVNILNPGITETSVEFHHHLR